MMTMQTRVPVKQRQGFGYAKALIFGEYAVLYGSACLVVGLSRKLVATCAVSCTPETDRAFMRHVSRLGLDPETHFFHFDHDAFYDASGNKLGIGSSAAMFVAAVDASCCHASPFGTIDDVMTAVRAHRLFQENMGSGADVIASALGGVLLVERCPDAPEIRRMRASTLPPFAILATHEAAATTGFLHAVKQHQNRPAFRKVIRKLTEQNEAFAHFILSSEETMPESAYRRAFLERIDQYAQLLEELQDVIEMPILSDTFKEIRRLAVPGRVAVKTSGAGGGDIMLVFACTDAELDAFCQEVSEKFHVQRLEVGLAEARGSAALQDPLPDAVVEGIRGYAEALESEAARMFLQTTVFALLLLILGGLLVLTQWQFSFHALLLMVGFAIFSLLAGLFMLYMQKKRLIDRIGLTLSEAGICLWDMKRFLYAHSDTYPMGAGLLRPGRI